MNISKINKFQGGTSLKGDKSISHRAAMFSAIAEGESLLSNYSSGKDCASTLSVINQLGIEVKHLDDKIVIAGKGLKGLTPSKSALDVGNSGTTIRLMSGILAGQNFESTITGDSSIQKRPMKRVIGPLRTMRAQISGVEDNYPPLVITGRKLGAIDYIPQIPSAQVKSCVLLGGLYAEGSTSVLEDTQTRDHTETMLDLEVEETFAGKRIIVNPDKVKIEGKEYIIPGDISSAYFLIVPALLCPGGKVRIENVGLNPTRTPFLELLQDIGAKIEISDETMCSGEPAGTITAYGSDLDKIEVDGNVVPSIIDEMPLLAVLGAVTGSEFEIRGAGELRVKESDRINAMVTNLSRFGADIRELEDGFVIGKKSKLRGAEIKSFHDHRIAMAMTIAAMFSEGESYLSDPQTASNIISGIF